MFEKSKLVAEVVEELEKGGYEVVQTEGSFDIAARRDKKLFLIKVLSNIDALSEDQAMSLRALAYFTDSQPVAIAKRNNRDALDEDVIYSRFDIPVMTPKLLEALTVQEDVSAISSAKGRHTVDVDAGSVRKKREEMGMTLEDLAGKIGLSKKAVYEIENRRVNPTKITADNLEKVLRVKIQKPYEISGAPETYLKPRDEMQKKVSKEFSRMGIKNSPIYSPYIENVGKEKFTVITSTNKDAGKIENKALKLRKLSGVFSSKAVFVLKNSKQENVSGVPIVLESELPEISSPKDLKKRIEEKE